MSAIDVIWHLLNLFAPALGLGTLSATGAKWLWRTELRAVSWRRLATWAVGASAAVTLVGLWVTGQDGRMSTYAAMVLGCAAALWWVGLRRAGRN
jgi:hypothetical protein